MNKLYKVTIEVDIMVMAENTVEAVTVARGVASNEVDEATDVYATLIEDIKYIPDDWKGSVPYTNMPYGSEIRKCKQIIEEAIPQKKEPQPELQLALEPQKVEKVAEVKEGKVQKGGVNKAPTIPQPPPPKGQGGKTGLSRSGGLRF